MTVRQMQDFIRNQGGAAVIEFGMVFPLVIACFCAIMFFGSYLFNVSRADHLLRDAGREIMLLDNPTLAEMQSALTAVMDTVALPGEDSNVAIETRSDGSRVAVITVEMTMMEYTPFLDTESFTHSGSLRAPLSDR